MKLLLSLLFIPALYANTVISVNACGVGFTTSSVTENSCVAQNGSNYAVTSTSWSITGMGTTTVQALVGASAMTQNGTAYSSIDLTLEFMVPDAAPCQFPDGCSFVTYTEDVDASTFAQASAGSCLSPSCDMHGFMSIPDGNTGFTMHLTVKAGAISGILNTGGYSLLTLHAEDPNGNPLCITPIPEPAYGWVLIPVILAIRRFKP